MRIKIILLQIIILIAVISCKKESEETKNFSIDKIQFTIDGIDHVFINKLFAHYDPLLTDQYITQFSCFTKQSPETVDSFSIYLGQNFNLDSISTPYKIENRWDFILQLRKDRSIFRQTPESGNSYCSISYVTEHSIFGIFRGYFYENILPGQLYSPNDSPDSLLIENGSFYIKYHR